MYIDDKEVEIRMNREMDRHNMAYKIEDKEGNIFVYSCIENGHPVYRCNGGSKHIFDLFGYKIIQSRLPI